MGTPKTAPHTPASLPPTSTATSTSSGWIPTVWLITRGLTTLTRNSCRPTSSSRTHHSRVGWSSRAMPSGGAKASTWPMKGISIASPANTLATRT